MSGSEEAAVTVDCRGRPCPIPVIELARGLPSVPVGAVIEVLSDDPAAATDIPAWCRMRAQEYLGVGPALASQGRANAGYAYRVRRLS